MKKVIISVIIPIYNAEKYLAKALESILSQTFESYEIVAVNDGSTDGSLSILTKYSEENPGRIRIVNQENAGAGAARNHGIESAAGEYILFVDADDSAEETMLADLYASAVKYNSEVVFCPFYRHGLYDEVTVEGTFSFSPGSVHTGKDFISETENIITTCTKLYRRDFIDRFRFPTHWFEDVALLPVLMSYARRITYVPRPYYHYLRHESSTVSSISDEQVLGSLDAVRYIRENSNPELVNVMAPYIAELLLFMCVRRPAFADRYISLLIEYRDYFLENIDFSGHSRLQTQLNFYFDEDYAMIPKRIYYDHFGRTPLSDRQEENIRNWMGTLVEFDAEIICLDEENCDITEHPLVEKAYREGRFKAVGQYFKLKCLTEKGGIALSPDIQGHKYITKLLTRTRSFFAYYDESRICSDIYASVAGQPVLDEISELFFKHISDSDAMSAALTELLIEQRGLSYSYQCESNFKSKYNKSPDGKLRIYSSNVLTRDYGLGTTITSICRQEPAVYEREGIDYCEVESFHYRTMQDLTRDYILYRKDIARQEYSKLNVKLHKKNASLREKLAEEKEALKIQKRKSEHYLSLINDIKKRKWVWFFYRISMKFFPTEK